MRADFYTNTHAFRRMEYTEVKELEVGDKVVIGIDMNHGIPKKMEFFNATITKPMYAEWDTLVVETDKGLADIYSIYEVKEL